ncbi:hypothetical protein NADE_005209 [Nannochloris sp. 'desiccata']|nr:hypothetical protein NADE_005209 [Chlorella desiccata (nom. nud.)]
MARFNALIALVAILLFLSAVGAKTSFIPRRALNGAEISNVQPGDVDGFRELLGRGGSRGGSRGGGGGGGSEENPVIVNFSVHVSWLIRLFRAVTVYKIPKHVYALGRIAFKKTPLACSVVPAKPVFNFQKMKILICTLVLLFII